MLNLLLMVTAFFVISSLAEHERTAKNDPKPSSEEDNGGKVYASQYYDQTNPHRA